MGKSDDVIELHISLTKYSRRLLERLSGVNLPDNSRKRISWILILEILNQYIKKHSSPTRLASRGNKSGSTRRIKINANAYPELFAYLNGLYKSQRTFKFESILYSLEDTIDWEQERSSPTLYLDNSVKPKDEANNISSTDLASQPSRLTKGSDNQEMLNSQPPSCNDNDEPQEQIKPEDKPTVSVNSDIDEFLDFMDF